MGEWARRFSRRASSLGEAVTSCGHPQPQRRIEKVKFGVALETYCTEDIPSPLLVLILKVNKEGPLRKDVFRAPGHEGAMKKLQHNLQVGRLISFEKYSVYTIASVIKKFLRKIPGGIFTSEGELELFASLSMSAEEQLNTTRNVIGSLPVCSQKLLCDMLGTFKAIELNAEIHSTGMTAEVIAVSVAPSFFQSCVTDGKTATLDDVSKFRVASKIMVFLIEQFTLGNLFPKPIYEHYARISGRIFRVNNELICTLKNPLVPRNEAEQQAFIAQLFLQEGKTWFQCECERWGKKLVVEDDFASGMEKSDDGESLPVMSQPGPSGYSRYLEVIPEDDLLDSCTRLSSSLDEIYQDPQPSTSYSMPGTPKAKPNTKSEFGPFLARSGATKSLSALPQVQQRQEERMRARSEWFLQTSQTVPEPSTRAAGLTRSKTQILALRDITNRITNVINDVMNFRVEVHREE